MRGRNVIINHPMSPLKHGLSQSATMIQMMMGLWVSRAIYVAAKLGIADRLKDGSKAIDELAKTTESHGPSLYRVLRALARIGIFVEDE